MGVGADDPIYCPKSRFRIEIVNRNSLPPTLHFSILLHLGVMADSLGNRQGNNNDKSNRKSQGREKEDRQFCMSGCFEAEL